MRVGMIGLGKLGLPVAYAIASKGHTVIGTDVRPMAVTGQEAGLQDFMDRFEVGWRDSIREVCEQSDLVFIAVQTPHDPSYEGVTVAPERRRDFEYGYLASAYTEACKWGNPTLAVISTVLPGTMRRTILPRGDAKTVYNPFFIAMGTTIADFLNPEFVIVGADGNADVMRDFYATIHDRPVVVTSIDSAELVKVAYNGFISAKIVVANWIGEICEKTGADADEVHGALAHATERLWSPRYFKAGMGDGGGCHPRDNIALSWLAERLDLSVDVGGFVTEARERHLEWIAQVVRDWANLTKLDVKILGPQYKPETDLVTGSPSRLLAELLTPIRYVDVTEFGAAVHKWRITGSFATNTDTAAVYVIGCQHDRYKDIEWPAGSVVIDPFGYIPDHPGVTVQRLGRK